MIAVLLIAVLGASVVGTRAVGAPAVEGASVENARTAYEAGEFSDALALYTAALDAEEFPRGAVLLAMGNCAYRLGRLSEAVLYYRRARLRLPRDPELAFNLRLAETRLGVERADREPLGTTVVRLAGAVTPGELVLLAGLLQSLGLLGAVVFRRRRGVRNALLAVALLGPGCGVRAARIRWFPAAPEGVVLPREVELLEEPRRDAAPTVELVAGSSVHVLEDEGEWIRVRHSRGEGWTPRSSLGIID